MAREVTPRRGRTFPSLNARWMAAGSEPIAPNATVMITSGGSDSSHVMSGGGGGGGGGTRRQAAADVHAVA
jgi:hypothetical protein